MDHKHAVVGCFETICLHRHLRILRYHLPRLDGHTETRRFRDWYVSLWTHSSVPIILKIDSSRKACELKRVGRVGSSEVRDRGSSQSVRVPPSAVLTV
jgi:hypothetical protein